MATTAMCNSFKAEVLQAIHNFTTTTGHVFKIALIKVSPSGTYDATLTNAGTPGSGTPSTSNIGTDEVTGTGYSSGGFAWTAAQNTTPIVNGGQGCVTWSVNPSWTTATFSTVAGVIYNSSQSNKAVSVHDFGGTQTVSSGTFTLTLPSQTANNAIIRIV